MTSDRNVSVCGVKTNDYVVSTFLFSHYLRVLSACLVKQYCGRVVRYTSHCSAYNLFAVSQRTKMAGAPDADGGFSSSKLGTLDYWEEAYDKELENFKDTGDVGEVWFGEDSMERVVDWLRDCPDVNQESSIIDLGCGNGMMLIELAKEGFTKLTGVDYSPKAISLAKSIAADENLEITYKTADILAPDGTETEAYDVCVDKGTYDAISLCPDEPKEKRSTYIRNVAAMLKAKCLLVLTSCNWSEDELTTHFVDSGYFTLVEKIPSPTFMFGGKTGNRETAMVFRKASK